MTPFARAYAALWALTAAPAALIAVVPKAAHTAQAHLNFAFAPADGTPAEALDILLTNGRVLAAITLAAWAAGRSGALRPMLDASVALTAALNVALVGVAIGAYGPRALAWLPHLPLEWAALACALAAYTQHRRTAQPLHTLAAPLAACAPLLVLAALAESYITAHTAALVT